MTRDQREASYVLPKSRTIPVLQTSLSLVVPTTAKLAVVVYGTLLGSTMGYSLTASARASLYLTPEVQEILIGILLGDGSIRCPKRGNPMISFKQGYIHLDYIL
jgi:hypothetical protein